MTIGKSNYSIGTEGWGRPTPARLKFWADLGLLVGMVGDTSFLTMPDFPGKPWVVWAIPFIAMLFKLITTFVYEHSQVPQDQQA
jgi:hypothetical protein